MAEQRKLRVFLCHASQEKPIVRELNQRLLSEGWIDPWLDEEKLLPGQDWNLEIEKAVETSDAVLVFLSDGSVKKEGYIQKELRFALNVALEKPEETIFIIPLRLDDCYIPRRLKELHYEDYFPEHKRDKAYKRLCKSLESCAYRRDIDIAALKRQYIKEKRNRELSARHVPGKAKILVMDDDRLWLDVFKTLVQHAGYEADGVETIEELKLCLENAAIHGEPYTIVITGMDFQIGRQMISLGKNILKFVKSNYPDMECAIITARRMSYEEILELRDEHEVAYILEKEMVDIDAITRIVRKTIARLG